MAKPVVVLASGGKPVVNVTGAQPATPVDTLGMPITLVDTLGMPMTLINEDGSAWSDGWEPSWVDNGGTAWLSHDGSTAIGADSATLELYFSLRAMDGLPAARTEIVHIPGARVNVYLTADWRMNVNLASTGGPLVTWQSTNNAAGILNDAGEWDFRMRAELDGTPTMEVWRREVTAGITGAWVTVTGAFSVGPTTGTIDSARVGAGAVGILANNAGANISDCQFGGFWWKSGALQSTDAFGAAGSARIDPALVGTPDLYVTGPVSSLTDDQGAGNKTLTVNGSFTDV
jgi:hypothetical protein